MHRLVGFCDHRLVAQAEGPGGGKKCLWWETPRDDRTLHAVEDLWRETFWSKIIAESGLPRAACPATCPWLCPDIFWSSLSLVTPQLLSNLWQCSVTLSTNLWCGSFGTSCFNICAFAFALGQWTPLERIWLHHLYVLPSDICKSWCNLPWTCFPEDWTVLALSDFSFRERSPVP